VSRPCTICKIPKVRAKVDTDWRSQKYTVRELGTKYGISLTILYNHCKFHVLKAVQGELAVVAPPDLPPSPAPPDLPPDATDLQKVDADIAWIEARRKQLAGKGVMEKDLAALTGQLLTARRLRAKIAGGEITPGMYARSAHFHRIWDSVVRALEEHPKALKAAVGAVLEVTGLREEEL
jgi:hypothetical protein